MKNTPLRKSGRTTLCDKTRSWFPSSRCYRVSPKFFLYLKTTALSSLSTIVFLFSPQALSEPQQAPSANAARPSGPALKEVLNVTELKIAMAESQLKLRQSDSAASELIAALEESLTTTCFGNIAKTLTYSGPPTDPLCLERMERLLQVNPDNPVGLCLRDGIEADSCKEAFRKQRLVSFSSSSMPDPDPALKLGLSNYERSLMEKLQQDLKPLDTQWAEAKTDEERDALLEAALPSYEKMMNTACKTVVLRINRLQSSANKESAEITEMREKLLRIPKTMREEYQDKLANEAEERLARASKGNNEEEVKNITALINVIRDPERSQEPLNSSNSERLRFVLPQCFDLLKSMKERLKDHPAPLCHTEGWYSPQCITSIKMYRAKMRAISDRKAAQTGARKSDSVIESF